MATVLLSSDDKSSRMPLRMFPHARDHSESQWGSQRKGESLQQRCMEKSKKLDEKKGEPEDLSSTSTTEFHTKTYKLRLTPRCIE